MKKHIKDAKPPQTEQEKEDAITAIHVKAFLYRFLSSTEYMETELAKRLHAVCASLPTYKNKPD